MEVTCFNCLPVGVHIVFGNASWVSMIIAANQLHYSLNSDEYLFTECENEQDSVL